MSSEPPVLSGRFTNPKLKVKEVIANVKEFGFTITAENLKEPTVEVFLPVYQAIAHLVFGQTKEDMRQPSFSAMDEFKYPELHEDSLAEIGMLKHILKVVHATGNRCVCVCVCVYMCPTYTQGRTRHGK
jgi:hypothetical protein